MGWQSRLAGPVLGPVVVLLALGVEARGPMSVVSENAHRKAMDRDLVRVIVQLRVTGLPEGRIWTVEAEASARQAIAEVQSTLLRELAGSDYRVVRTYETIPFLALEVSVDALRALEGSALVMNIKADRVESPLSKPDGPTDYTGHPLADPNSPS